MVRTSCQRRWISSMSRLVRFEYRGSEWQRSGRAAIHDSSRSVGSRVSQCLRNPNGLEESVERELLLRSTSATDVSYLVPDYPPTCDRVPRGPGVLVSTSTNDRGTEPNSCLVPPTPEYALGPTSRARVRVHPGALDGERSGGAFIARHGSWIAATCGYDFVFVRFDESGQPTQAGWSESSGRYGRRRPTHRVRGSTGDSGQR